MPPTARVRGLCHCGTAWTSARYAHCPTCHHSFSVLANFDAHRRHNTCADPASAGLFIRRHLGPDDRSPLWAALPAPSDWTHKPTPCPTAQPTPAHLDLFGEPIPAGPAIPECAAGTCAHDKRCGRCNYPWPCPNRGDNDRIPAPGVHAPVTVNHGMCGGCDFCTAEESEICAACHQEWPCATDRHLNPTP
ncbi:hypothetical protein SAMN05421505_120121 [Sinosporangium album]|uniref:Phage FDXHR zinc binding domain-containing protein n=1 Tax=Sinosporangium album TaxID=504805 RepID=A0A1G8EIY4_9ACTN|nr:hypothetical protein [Sinosporangium album]SDH69837.1 hypothetical protein SAMN05421505_120121 [Sinosporangium album]